VNATQITLVVIAADALMLLALSLNAPRQRTPA